MLSPGQFRRKTLAINTWIAGELNRCVHNDVEGVAEHMLYIITIYSQKYIPFYLETIANGERIGDFIAK